MKYNSLILFFLFIIFGTTSCHFGRMAIYGTEDITDHKIFPKTPIKAAATNTFTFELAPPNKLQDFRVPSSLSEENLSLDEFLSANKTTAFLVIQNDSILFENYYRGYDEAQVSNIFSVSKSVTSLLLGIAMDEGLITSVEDKVVQYVPDLAEKNKDFEQLKIIDLLNMRSGLKFREGYASPFSEVARLYYGKDQLKQIQGMEFAHKPGEVHEYQSVSTTILGMIVENTSGMKLGEYLEKKVWQPMGMEFDASWSVDDKKNRRTKAFCCLNTTARDLAKIGKLYLDGGNWQGEQIVARAWVEQSTTPFLENDCYQYQWYNTGGKSIGHKGEFFKDSLQAQQIAVELGLKDFTLDYTYIPSRKDSFWMLSYCSDAFYGLGVNGQYLYVEPKHNLIMVRLGKKFDSNYEILFREIRNHLRE